MYEFIELLRSKGYSGIERFEEQWSICIAGTTDERLEAQFYLLGIIHAMRNLDYVTVQESCDATDELTSIVSY